MTIATGKQLYVDMAINLARSFFWWHKDTDIQFLLVTDQPDLIPNDIRSIIKLTVVNPGELGLGFSTKLFLDKIAPEGQTLFIDSDCLVFGDLLPVFNRFRGMPVSVVGNYIFKGEWFGDIGAICNKFNVRHIPKFNGGLYYLEKGKAATRVYEQARLLEKQYDEIGFVRLRNRPNDEVLMALAMQLEGMKPLIDDGTIMSDPQACPGEYKTDVIKGEAVLTNPPLPHPLHQSWYQFQKVTPLIVHFLGQYTKHYPYKREVYRLNKAMDHQLALFDNVKSRLIIEYPGRIKLFLKDTFRNTYHKIFGVRKIDPSDRII